MANNNGDMDKILKTLDEIISKEDGDVKALQQKLATEIEEANKNLQKVTGKVKDKIRFIQNTSKRLFCNQEQLLQRFYQALMI